MKIQLALTVLVLSGWSAAALPYINNTAVTVLYTNVTDPMLMSFAPDGTLYVGRDARGSGGDAFDPVFITKVGTNASSVENFGNILTKDPDAVAYDQLGLVSGTPGAVIVGGTTGTNTSIISKIQPNGIITTLFGGVLANVGNPRQIIFDSAGRAYITDNVGNQVLTTASGAAPTQLCISSNAHGIAIDSNNRLAVTSVTLPRIQLFSTNGTLLVSNFAAVKAESPIARGPGGAFWGTDLYSVNQSGRLIRIDPAGNVTDLGGTGFGGQVELAFGPSNALYVSELSTDRIYIIREKIVNLPLPIHWWPGEGNGNDIIGGAHGLPGLGEGYSSNNTTPRVSYPAGVVGQCFRSDTNGTAFTFGTNTCNVGTNDFTLSFWFTTTNANLLRGLFSKTPSCFQQPGWAVYINGGRLRFLMNGTNGMSSTDHWSDLPINDGSWHHLAAVRAKTNVYVYMDGALQTGPHGNGGSTVASTSALLNINNAGLFTMGGSLGIQPSQLGWCYQSINEGDHYDEVQFYDVALDADQISKLASLQANAFGPPTLNIAKLATAVRLTWTTNSPGYALQTNANLTPANWGVLTTNYSIIGADYAVTNTIGGAARFYRLSKP